MSSQIQEYGWKIILQKIVLEATQLRDEGITITNDGKQVTIKVVVCCVVGDNLAVHSLGGFSVLQIWKMLPFLHG